MNRASHILVPLQTLRGGGVEKAALRLTAAWLAAGRRVTLVIGSEAGPLAADLPPGAELLVLGDDGYRALAAALPGVVQASAPDLIFCPGNHYTAVAAWLRWRLGRRCPPIVGKVSNALGRTDWAAPGYAAWLRLHPRFLNAAVAMTPGMAEATVAALRMPASRVRVIPNMPPQSDVAPAAVLAGPHLLGVGRLARQKRWERAVAALPELPGVPLAILGEGDERAALVAQAAALGVGERLYLPGYAPDPAGAIAGATVLVLTSDHEGVPGVVREALALGTPVVSTDSSVAVRELIDTPERGTVVPVGDHGALVAALRHWLEPGRARPVARTVQGDPAGDYLALFDELVGASSS